MLTVRRFLSDTTGATAIEYGLIAGMIAVVIISAVKNTGTNANKKFQAIAANLN